MCLTRDIFSFLIVHCINHFDYVAFGIHFDNNTRVFLGVKILKYSVVPISFKNSFKNVSVRMKNNINVKYYFWQFRHSFRTSEQQIRVKNTEMCAHGTWARAMMSLGFWLIAHQPGLPQTVYRRFYRSQPDSDPHGA